MVEKDDGARAVLQPVAPRKAARRRRGKTATARYEAFRSAFGGWKDLVDGEALKEQLAAARGSDRPRVAL